MFQLSAPENFVQSDAVEDTIFYGPGEDIAGTAVFSQWTPTDGVRVLLAIDDADGHEFTAELTESQAVALRDALAAVVRRLA